MAPWLCSVPNSTLTKSLLFGDVGTGGGGGAYVPPDFALPPQKKIFFLAPRYLELAPLPANLRTLQHPCCLLTAMNEETKILWAKTEQNY